MNNKNNSIVLTYTVKVAVINGRVHYPDICLHCKRDRALDFDADEGGYCCQMDREWSEAMAELEARDSDSDWAVTEYLKD